MIAEERFAARLQHELEKKDLEVIASESLSGGRALWRESFDLVVLEEALLGRSRNLAEAAELLEILRLRSPSAHFVLLAEPGERFRDEEVAELGFDLVLERPIRPEAIPEVTRFAR
jgi:hypothetical protein